MIRTETVFIVGAGASCELGFPSGSKLLEDIATDLDFYRNGFDLVRGDEKLHQLFRRVATEHVPEQIYFGAASRIRDAAHLGLSIDNVIHQLDHELAVPACAKLAIARRLLIAENSSFLRIDTSRRDAVPLVSLRATWLGPFLQLLVQDKKRSELEDIFDKVSVVSFNYDRTIRRFMPFGLSSQFGLSDEEARSLTRKLRIYYPYGSLGPLPWEGPTGGVEFGDEDAAALPTVAQSLRTFTEQIDDADDLAEMRLILSTAQRIVFLGFGYHNQNIELLQRMITPDAASVLGTSVGLSPSDEEAVKGQLSFFFRENYRPYKDAILRPLKCVEFLDHHFRTLVS